MSGLFHILIISFLLLFPAFSLYAQDGSATQDSSSIPEEKPASPPSLDAPPGSAPTQAEGGSVAAPSKATTTQSSEPKPLRPVSSSPSSETVSPEATPEDISPLPDTSTDNNFLLYLIAIGAAVAGGLGYGAYALSQKNKPKKSNPCDSIKKRLEQKRNELTQTSGEISIQQTLVNELKKKLEAKQNEMKENIVNLAKEKVFELEKSGTIEKTVGLAEDVKETYDSLKGKYEQIQKVLEILGLKKNGLSDEVRALEAAYMTCMAGLSGGNATIKGNGIDLLNSDIRMNRPVHFEIYAEKPERAATFYTALFGWKFDKWGDQDYWMIMTTEKDSQEPGINGGMMMRKGPAPVDGQAVTGYVCTMQVENIDETIKKIESLGGKLALPKFAIPGMAWQAYYKDTEGNIFGVHQPDQNAK